MIPAPILHTPGSVHNPLRPIERAVPLRVADEVKAQRRVEKMRELAAGYGCDLSSGYQRPEWDTDIYALAGRSIPVVPPRARRANDWPVILSSLGVVVVAAVAQMLLLAPR